MCLEQAYATPDTKLACCSHGLKCVLTEADEATNAVEELPEGHDLPSDVGGRELADVNWSRH